MSRRTEVGVFASESALLDAARECRERGLEILDVFSPYPVHGIDEIAGVRRSRIAGACLAGGVVGLSLGLWLQHWTSATDWPIDVGGKPWNSLPAFAPVAFELTVLFAGLAVVGTLLVRSRLLPGRRPRLADLGTTDDHFALVVAQSGSAFAADDLGALWRRHGAVATRHLVDGEVQE